MDRQELISDFESTLIVRAECRRSQVSKASRETLVEAPSNPPQLEFDAWPLQGIGNAHATLPMACASRRLPNVPVFAQRHIHNASGLGNRSNEPS